MHNGYYVYTFFNAKNSAICPQMFHMIITLSRDYCFNQH